MSESRAREKPAPNHMVFPVRADEVTDAVLPRGLDQSSLGVLRSQTGTDCVSFQAAIPVSWMQRLTLSNARRRELSDVESCGITVPRPGRSR